MNIENNYMLIRFTDEVKRDLVIESPSKRGRKTFINNWVSNPNML